MLCDRVSFHRGLNKAMWQRTLRRAKRSCDIAARTTLFSITPSLHCRSSAKSRLDQGDVCNTSDGWYSKYGCPSRVRFVLDVLVGLRRRSLKYNHYNNHNSRYCNVKHNNDKKGVKRRAVPKTDDQSVADAVNALFHQNDTGVIMHVLDLTEDSHNPWLACLSESDDCLSWKPYGRLSFLIMNQLSWNEAAKAINTFGDLSSVRLHRHRGGDTGSCEMHLSR